MANKTILFADDSATMRYIVEKTFAAEPFDVVCVPSGEGAVAKAVEIRPDVIIADAGMPGVSGYDVCRSVRENASIGGTPVILMSGVSNLYDDARGSDAGVTEHMKKPFDTGLLIELVTRLAETSPAVSASESDGLTLEPVPDDDGDDDLALSEPPLPLSEPPLPLSEPPIPLDSAIPIADDDAEPLSEPPIPLGPSEEKPAEPLGVQAPSAAVGKQTQDYAISTAAAEEDDIGAEVDFGDDAGVGGEPSEVPPDVAPIEIEPSTESAEDSSSFHVGTLAELAQMDSAGRTLETDPHEEAIELAPAASSLASLGPKMSEDPDGPVAIPESEPPVSVTPAEPASVAASESVSDRVRAEAESAAEKIAAGVDGITAEQAAAIQTLTREIIERIVWEVVPDLAEVIIKEELSKLLKE